MLQVGRSRVRLPMGVIDFFSVPNTSRRTIDRGVIFVTCVLLCCVLLYYNYYQVKTDFSSVK
jgi:hypothetical protein